MMDRAKHLAWAKARARAYVEAGDLSQAVASMTSDLRKHDGFDREAVGTLHLIGMMEAMRDDAGAVRRWVEGFN
jgi:hypothetical protein